MVIHNRTAILMWVYATVIPVAFEAGAAEPDSISKNNFVDMPEEYREELQKKEREESLKKGDIKDYPGYVPGYRHAPGLSLSPHAPQLATAMPAGVGPSFGAPVYLSGKEFKFSFHGYLQPVLRMGFGKSVSDETSIHADPSVPGGAYGWFDSTNTLPTPWTQINFVCGNEIVNATVIIGAWSTVKADEASGMYMGHAQQLFAEAYLTYTPDISPLKLEIKVGAFPDRYGFMSQWHKGAYGVSLIGDIYGAGATGSLWIPFVGDFDVIVEGGFKGEIDKAPIGIAADGSNEYARSEEGSTFAAHGHLGVFFAKYFTPTFHFIYNWSQDDRGDPPDDPTTPLNDTQQHKDGSLRILGGDLRIDGKRFGYLYAGGSHVKGKYTGSLTDMVQVLNTGSGYFFNERFWGFASKGNGDLTLAGLQYGLSLGTLLRHPVPYWGVGPDLIVNVFGIYGYSDSTAAEIKDRHMLKWGAEATYNFSKYVGVSFRFDHVMPDLAGQSTSFGVITPKLIIRSNWNSRESLIIQYSYFAVGDDVIVRGDNRMTAPSDTPDRHMLALYGTIWW